MRSLVISVLLLLNLSTAWAQESVSQIRSSANVKKSTDTSDKTKRFEALLIHPGPRHIKVTF